MQPVTIFAALDYVTQDEIVVYPYDESRAHHCYGPVEGLTLVLGLNELGVLSGKKDFPLGYANQWSA